MTLSDGSREFLLALADDEHMIGARHTSWIGLGPFLEEDLAFCSIAQDELGHAIALYEILLDDAGRSRDELDAFAIMRDAKEFRSCQLAEVECGAWSDSLVRHWLYDRAESLRWEALLDSSDQAVASLAARALREESFHLAHAAQFMSRIAPDRPRQILDSIDRLLPLAIRQWQPVDGEPAALADGVATASSAELAERWELAVRADLADWNLEVAWPAVPDVASRTERSVGFDDFLTGLRKVIVLDEAAVW
ncbi:1,2-phenylacetyl-CoA epoxidase subunit PaaC [Ilumatobacter coccineus]|uniref:Putative ring-hydroxylation complex protein PaaI n=1 Tax=Ilumatobacter coccineus (strain NBRC 103263 / KCTC 29153 / YM16-304) TaxID=1313172 RepID=A0A6C7E0U9_ILUCY|nr:1,2-phenylacetyl-CoA epoxidase subunit PaaC [Ilumatobacter coccineus]BAN00630.1 putative ring-hydroxylation complex protein PaaI [Ilumatobacter coccineus YM16-304]